MKRAVTVLALLFTLLLAGCGTPGKPAGASAGAMPRVGDRLVLEKPIPLAPNQVSVLIQYGKLTTARHAKKYRPYCKLEMWNKHDRAQTIEPDTFTVTAVNLGDWYVRNTPRVGFIRVDHRDDGGPMAVIMSTKLRLHSARQPDVYRMTCSDWDDLLLPHYLTSAEIAGTLKGLFRLEPTS